MASTQNVQIMLIQGRPSINESMKHYSPSFRKPCYKRERGVRPMWTHVDRGEGVINLIPFVDLINGWPRIPSDLPPFLFNFPLFFKFPLFSDVLMFLH